jgi:glutamine amidotransferase PdxT
MGTIRAPIGQALSAMVVTYLLTLGGAYILALSIDVLATNFHGTRTDR